MPKRVSDVIEEYLETIYRLQERSGIAKTSDLVAMLNVAPGTITNTIERLERNLLVVHEPYRGVRLTDEGHRIALDVVRRHRLIERLLTDLLDIEWDKAHELACDLEHWIDSEVARKIEHVLRCPRVCPHGNPIPTEDGEIIDEEVYPLTEFRVGEKGIISRIIEETPEFLKYLGELGVKPERAIEIIHKAPRNDPITIKVDGRIQALSHRAASFIMIRRAKE